MLIHSCNVTPDETVGFNPFSQPKTLPKLLHHEYL